MCFGGVTVWSGTTDGSNVGSTEHPCECGAWPQEGASDSKVPLVDVDALVSATVDRLHQSGLLSLPPLAPTATAPAVLRGGSGAAVGGEDKR